MPGYWSLKEIRAGTPAKSEREHAGKGDHIRGECYMTIGKFPKPEMPTVVESDTTSFESLGGEMVPRKRLMGEPEARFGNRQGSTGGSAFLRGAAAAPTTTPGPSADPMSWDWKRSASGLLVVSTAVVTPYVTELTGQASLSICSKHQGPLPMETVNTTD
ncbi:hypothetical protein E5288_WYG022239 [Bos mutus]|uniref:Uncharacterized protein n=1 Tax=Bos mutus TaxID=72004 RepID=A0A6B0S0M0_9CETA|nr:hypothetical protein [Bos mutus]